METRAHSFGSSSNRWFKQESISVITILISTISAFPFSLHKKKVQPTLLKPFHHSRMARWLLQSLWPIKAHWSQASQTYQGDEPFAKGGVHSEGFEWSLRLFISYKSWWILILQIRKQHCWELQWTTCSRTIGSCKRSSSTSSNLNLWMPSISHFESSVWAICLLFVIQTRII